MKGIILAGGAGTRLLPLTSAISKQMLPVYDKPMIYYPLSVLMLAGIKEILLISTPRDLPFFKETLGDGSRWGISIVYAAQPEPGGLPQAFLIGADFIGGQPCAMILGDNLFFGEGIGNMVSAAVSQAPGAAVFCTRVKDPQRYGVISFGVDGRPKSLEEKPKRPSSNWALTGLYLFDGDVSRLVSELTPSARGELEIVDLINIYFKRNTLASHRLGRGYAWFDAGTHDSLLDASEFVRTIELRQGLKIACLEEIALQRGLISTEAFNALAKQYPVNGYGDYLRSVAADLGRGD